MSSSNESLLPEDVRAQARRIMDQVNSDDSIPGVVVTHSEELVIKVFVDEEAYAASQSGRYELVFPKRINQYRVQYVNLHVVGRPIPFSNGDEAEHLVELLMPLNGDYGVMRGATREVDGGWQVDILVGRKYNRLAVERIINEHAPGYDVQITEIDGRVTRH